MAIRQSMSRSPEALAAPRAAAFIALVFLIVAGCGCPAAARCADDIIDEALRAMMMTRDDLHFRTDYADQIDSFRLVIADSLLSRPLATPDYVREIADEFPTLPSLEGALRTCARELDLVVDDRAVSVEPVRHPEGKGPPPDALEILITALDRASHQIELAFAGVSESERRFVTENAGALLEEEEFDPDKPIDEKDREQKEEEELGDELLRIAGHVDYSRIATAGAIIARAIDIAEPIVQEMDIKPRDKKTPTPWASGDVLRAVQTQVGPVVIGGRGTTIYNAPCAVIIDLGGDDVYTADVAGTDPSGIRGSVVIDVSGDDTYLAGDYSLGGGMMGVAALLDVQGDDAYSAGNFSLGSGLFGVGILLDRDGNDTYTGDTCTEGSGAFGIGVLLDEAGNDRYESALFSQAFGFVMGFGLLDDRGGNDFYFAGGKYTDEIRYFDHFLSLSQGFGFGWRPDASGGIGIMVDRAGNDVYVSDIFGQGSSYWFAVGGLVDYDGNDNYVSYQYAQGAATHITVAALVDMSGDDNYVSKGVSQGCGHDLAIGFLHDIEGDDNYTCHDLSQAAGNANGIGILLDESGDDSYSVRNPDNTHGYGNRRRDYGSIGLILDCDGSDAYVGRGEDESWWGYSDFGAGVDSRNEAEPEEPEAAEQEEDDIDERDLRAELVGLSPEELFLRASSSALQFADMLQPARDILIEDPQRSLPYLVTRLDTDDARERNALEDVLVRIGDSAVDQVVESVRGELERTDTTRGARLGARVLGRLGETRAADVLVEVGSHADWKARASAAEALGRIGGDEAPGALTDLLADANEIVRKSAAVGLARTAEDTTVTHFPDASVDALIAALDDRLYSVRHSAARALAAVGEQAVPSLSGVASQDLGAASHLAIWALGEIGSDRALADLWKLAESDDWATRGFSLEAIGKIGIEKRDKARLKALLREEEHPFVLAKAKWE